MRLNFSWRQRFLALIVITPIGLMSIAAVVFWGLGKVSSSYESMYEAARYENTSARLIGEWNNLEQSLRDLDATSADDIAELFENIGRSAAALVRESRTLNDPEVEQKARQIQAQVLEALSLRRAWLEQMEAVGLLPSEGLRAETQAALQKLRELSLSLFEQAIAEIGVSLNTYVSTRNTASADAARNAVAKMEAIVAEYGWGDNVVGETTVLYRKAFDRLDGALVRVIEFEEQAAAESSALQRMVSEQSAMLQDGIIARTIRDAQAADRSAKLAILGVIAVVAPLLMLALLYISRALVGQLARVVELLSGVASGDLSRKLELNSNPNDEFTSLGQAANKMIDDISEVMERSVVGTENLMQIRGELEQTMSRLAQNSEKVEAQTIQAATGGQQISVTLSDVARRASEVGASTQSANESAQTGARVVQESVRSMQDLSKLIQTTHGHVQMLTESSTKVTGIIDVINSLADQTNLLALNAAIEAARAGEAGRGFSVVADEVRSLAQKTVAATTNIGGIIEGLNNQTRDMESLMQNGLGLAKEGEQSASEIANAMSGVTRSIDSLTSEMDQVVVAVEEISVTTDDIAQKMEEIRGQSSETHAIGIELGQQNERLSSQAATLADVSRRFKLR